MTKSNFLHEISQELGRFDANLLGWFKCPTCLSDLPIEGFGRADFGNEISEEHIIPAAVGGKKTIFLCKVCNSKFGHRQTKWLVDWIALNEGGAPFYRDAKKQTASLSAGEKKLNGSLSLDDDGAIRFFADRRRSNPADFDSFWSDAKTPEIRVSFALPVFANEDSLRVGFLTAAYGLWFKNFGYSFVLQSTMSVVREQISNPREAIMDWQYVHPVPSQKICEPCIGLMRFDKDYFPFAVIYDHFVLLPAAHKLHPSITPWEKVSQRFIRFEKEVAPRYQNRCIGPAELICDGQVIIQPDLTASAAVTPQKIEMKGWF
jgi:hypothetical protein